MQIFTVFSWYSRFFFILLYKDWRLKANFAGEIQSWKHFLFAKIPLAVLPLMMLNVFCGHQHVHLLVGKPCFSYSRNWKNHEKQDFYPKERKKLETKGIMFEPRSYRIFSHACFVKSSQRDRIRDPFKIIGFSEQKILLKPKVLSSNPKDFFVFLTLLVLHHILENLDFSKGLYYEIRFMCVIFYKNTA